MFFNKFFFLLAFEIGLVFSLPNWRVSRSQLNDRPSSLTSISTSLGTVVGYKQVVANKTINAFYGLPYAEMPFQRFKRAKLIKKFPTEPYLATEFKPHCIMENISSSTYFEDKYSEDCLFMNLYTPNIEQYKSNGTCSRKFAVMLFVVAAKSSIYKMSFLVREDNSTTHYYNGELYPALHDTIFIVFNFRSCLISELIAADRYKGNLALFDISLAVRWVRKNIKDYCGDESRVTLAGHSSGAHLVSLSLISDYSKHMIDKAIIMSGKPMFAIDQPVTKNELLVLSFKIYNEMKCLKTEILLEDLNLLNENIRLKYFSISNQKYKLKTHLFLNELDKGFDGTKITMRNKINPLRTDDYFDGDFIELVRFLSNAIVDFECVEKVDANRLIALNNLAYNRKSLRWFTYYDNDFIDSKTYLDYKLFNKLNFNPNIKLLVGNIEDEDAGTIAKFKTSDKYYMDQFTAPVIPKEDVMDMIRETFLATNQLQKENDTLFAEMGDYYANEEKWALKRGYFDSVFNAVNDFKFFCPQYFYTYYGSMTAKSIHSYFITQTPTKHHGSALQDVDLDTHSWIKSTHGDDLLYMVGHPFRMPNQFTDVDRKFSLQLMEMYATFVKEGRLPRLSNGKKWPVSTKSDNLPKYVEVNSNLLRERKFEFEERCEKFWRQKLPYYKV